MNNQFYVVGNGGAQLITHSAETTGCCPCTNAGETSTGNHFTTVDSQYDAILDAWKSTGPNFVCEGCILDNCGEGAIIVDANTVWEALELADKYNNQEIQLTRVSTDHGSIEVVRAA